MDVALNSKCITSEYFFLNSNLRAKFQFTGLFAWWVSEASNYGHEYDYLTDYMYESNISAFGRLFHEVCFKGGQKIVSNRLVEDARQLIKRCRAKDPESRPTMKDVVTEMEAWNLT
ncbi:hypothetical protein M378DRAFT_296449 [Amanita muscaria Koide BX008]|uniref:Uncharacterized protein n=1 Tax=Amanita muscaria (strain Koide BX008) TaxID=946122 RepID=A0A0C2SUT2_AMAMK|nr:hypothetical protein M378DRAFT_296449 [Amanita muscaria Koide BX008]